MSADSSPLPIPSDPDTLVRVSGVSKKFCLSLKKSLWYGLCDMGRELTGRRRGEHGGLRTKEFWAVNNVSFELKRGECLGLIGRNGAGKTTLLKMLNGLIKPDAGRIEMRGRVGALIALGAGFNPVLTGRENIYVNGSVLGLTKKEIDSKLDEIIDFAEIGEFIDTPVQNYSSGMAVRLGFAVAAVLIQPDILLLDEVLAVGDAAFRSKCYAAISDMMENAAVILVSHQMPTVTRICNRVILMGRGEKRFDGDPHEGADLYSRLFGTDEVKSRHLGTGEAEISGFQIRGREGCPIQRCAHGDEIVFAFQIEVDPRYQRFIISLSLNNRDGELVAHCHSKYNEIELCNTGRQMAVEIRIPRVELNPGTYAVNLVVFDDSNMRHLDWRLQLASLEVTGRYRGAGVVLWQADWGLNGPGLSPEDRVV